MLGLDRCAQNSTVALRLCCSEILPGVDESAAYIASLLRQRNEIDSSIAKVINRPVTAGDLGELIASQIFDIVLEESAATQGFDGCFRSGPLQACTVNIK